MLSKRESIWKADIEYEHKAILCLPQLIYIKDMFGLIKSR